MRKITKAPIFLAALATMLTSCSTDSMAGTYSFQMGKETGTHFGVYLKLTDKKYVSPDPDVIVNEKSKQCEFSFSVKFGDDTDSIASLLEIIAAFLEQDPSKITIPGYYYRGDRVDKEGEVEIKLGIDFSFLKEVYEDIDMTGIKFPELTPDTIEKVVYTTYSGNTVTINIPVSEVDVLYQLYWYGIDYNLDADGKIVKNDTPFPANEPGTHPTASDITTINETYKYAETHNDFAKLFDMDLSAYRDYYTLAMGLVKK